MGSSASNYAFERRRSGKMPIQMLLCFAIILSHTLRADGAVIQPDGVHPVPPPFGPGITTITDPSTMLPTADPTIAASTSDILTILETSSTTAIPPTLPLSGMLSVADGGIPPAPLPSFMSMVIPAVDNGTVVVSMQSSDALQPTSVPDIPSFATGMNSSDLSPGPTFTTEPSPESTSPLSTWPTFSIPPNLASALSTTSLQMQTASLPASIVSTTISGYQPLLPSPNESPSNVTFSQPSMSGPTSGMPSVTTPSTTTTTTSNLTTTLYLQTTVIITTDAPVQTLSMSNTGTGTCLSGEAQVASPPILPARQQISNATSLSTDSAELGDPCTSVFTTTVYVTPTMTGTWTTITVTVSAPNNSLSNMPPLTPAPNTGTITSYVTNSAISTLPVPMSAPLMPSFSSMITSYSTSSQPQTTMSVSMPIPTVDSTSLNFSSMVASYNSGGSQLPTPAAPTISTPGVSSSVPGLSSMVTSPPLMASVTSPAPTLGSTMLNFSSMVAGYETEGAKSSNVSNFTSLLTSPPPLSAVPPSSTKGETLSTSVFKNPAPSHPGFSSNVPSAATIGPKKSSTSASMHPAPPHHGFSTVTVVIPSLTTKTVKPDSTSAHKDPAPPDHASSPLPTTKVVEPGTTITLKNPLASHAAVLEVSEQHSVPTVTATSMGIRPLDLEGFQALSAAWKTDADDTSDRSTYDFLTFDC
ncbi:hypothetical protein PV11_02222 [Exophiala sideris]|uniref:Uncharacterized protein n=1 Tax=Exophiala sideris TaxID=1016849 RepID=A0A0D1YVQ2_9EURO|nr:hypothetical protein PV11_02222 [Exophiala sideris]